MKILLNTYSPVRSLEFEGGEWLHIDTANLHFAKLCRRERLNITSEVNLWADVLEAETNLRTM